MLPHEPLKQRELRPIDRFGNVRTPHVIHNNNRRQRREEVPQIRQVDSLETDHHMPAQPGHAARNLQQFFLGCEIHQALDEVEPYPTHPGRMHSNVASVTSLRTVATPRTRPPVAPGTGASRGRHTSPANPALSQSASVSIPPYRPFAFRAASSRENTRRALPSYTAAFASADRIVEASIYRLVSS
jgi:hypothetical protein